MELTIGTVFHSYASLTKVFDASPEITERAERLAAEATAQELEEILVNHKKYEDDDSYPDSQREDFGKILFSSLCQKSESLTSLFDVLLNSAAHRMFFESATDFGYWELFDGPLCEQFKKASCDDQLSLIEHLLSKAEEKYNGERRERKEAGEIASLASSAFEAMRFEENSLASKQADLITNTFENASCEVDVLRAGIQILRMLLKK